jgi:hypothetical protein
MEEPPKWSIQQKTTKKTCFTLQPRIIYFDLRSAVLAAMSKTEGNN